MSEPSEESVERATAALMPFARAFSLAVNPEDIQFMAYAAVRFADSAEGLPGINQAVGEMIADHYAADA